jgi:hypothetical protein
VDMGSEQRCRDYERVIEGIEQEYEDMKKWLTLHLPGCMLDYLTKDTFSKFESSHHRC